MPPFSPMNDEEGVVVYNVLLVLDLALREPALRALFVGERWPARIPSRPSPRCVPRSSPLIRACGS